MEGRARRFCPRRRWVTVLLLALSGVLLAAVLTFAAVNLTVYFSEKDRIVSADTLASGDFDADLVVILGAGLQRDGSPSHMLADRITVGVGLYQSGVGSQILMSGDRSSDAYDEPRAMEAFALQLLDGAEGVIVCDGEGYSTYESLVRVREQYGEDVKIVIVTQTYHLYRALEIADALGLDARGVSADLRSYQGQWIREVRETMARVKDFFLVRFGDNG